MCRFLLLSAPTIQDMRPFIQQFAQMCEHSKGLEGGGWQGDGWGVAWQDAQNGWCVQRSLEPIWTEPDTIVQLPASRHVLVHARSASFPHHKGNMAYIEPYVQGRYAFVFNGFLKGVKLPRPVPGAIGAEKIWHLAQEQIAQGATLSQALANVYALLKTHSRAIQACNMALSDGQSYAFYNGNPRGLGYYQLRQATQGTIHIVASEPFGAWEWQPYQHL